MKLKNRVRIIITFLIIGILFYKIGVINILEIISQSKKIYFLHFTFLTLFNVYLSGININLLLKKIDKKLKSRKITKYSLITSIISLITPGRTGELGIIFLMKKKGIGLGEGTAIVFLDKIISIVVIIFFSIIGFFYFKFQNSLIISSIAIGVLLILIVLGYTEYTRRIIREYILRKYSKKFKGFHQTLYLIKKSGKKEITINLILTIFRQIIVSLSIYFIFISLNQKIAFFSILLINSMITILSYIPITIQGLGIKEGGAILIFSVIGIPAEITLSTYILFTTYKYIIGGISGIILSKEIKDMIKNERDI